MLKVVHEHNGPENGKRAYLDGTSFKFYCVAHQMRSEDRSPVTIFQGCWAYCPHGYGTGHEWAPIEPISDVNLKSFGPTFLTPLRKEELTVA